MKSVAWSARLVKQVSFAAAFGLLAVTAAPADEADYRFQLHYRVSLGALPIGNATLVGTFEGPKYRIDGFGKLTGIAGVLYEYSASASSAGRLQAGKTQANAFSVNASDGKKTATIRMTMTSAGVRQLKITPTPTPYHVNHPNRVKVTEADKRGIIDPISALFVPGGYSVDGFDKRACQRSVPIFNGQERFDVNLEYRAIQSVSGGVGFADEVLVCTARYRAIAGHRTDKDEVKTAEKISAEVMLTPVPGSDILVPYRVTIPTPLGAAVVQATELTASGALQSRAAALAD